MLCVPVAPGRTGGPCNSNRNKCNTNFSELNLGNIYFDYTPCFIGRLVRKQHLNSVEALLNNEDVHPNNIRASE